VIAKRLCGSLVNHHSDNETVLPSSTAAQDNDCRIVDRWLLVSVPDAKDLSTAPPPGDQKASVLAARLFLTHDFLPEQSEPNLVFQFR
jgi:hypothetical protein